MNETFRDWEAEEKCENDDGLFVLIFIGLTIFVCVVKLF